MFEPGLLLVGVHELDLIAVGGWCRLRARARISSSQRILDCGDLATIDRWLDRALTVTAIDELFEQETAKP